MKRILFYTHTNPQGYRIQQYFPYLERRGFEVELCTTDMTLLELASRVKASDVVYIQRILMSPLKLSLIRAAAKRMVFDFDDAVMYGSKGESETRRRKFRKMVAASDAVFAGNRFLFDEAKRYRTDGVYYVPTVVDTDEYAVKSHEASTGPMTAGWIGSSSTLRYLDGLEGLMRSLTETGTCSFEVVADEAPHMTVPGLTFRKWEKEKEKGYLLGFDAGLMPLTDDIWARGKCGLKLIQYMASGLPSIAHPVGAANEIIEDGVSGFLRGEAEGWTQALQRLVSDLTLRQKMGRYARTVVEERYSLAAWGPKVAEIIDSL